MAQSIEIQKQRIKEFYRGKSAEDQKTTQSLYEYDENGNYVIYTTDKTNSKTIPPIKYRLATPEELQADDEAYASRVRKMKEDYAQKRAELFTESTRVSPNTKLLYKLNMELRNIDKKLISAQYVHNDIIEYDRFTTNIRMRNIFFENAVEDRKVEEDLVMIEAYRIPVQRGFVQESSTVSVPEANVLSADASPLEEQIRKTIRQTKAAAKSAAAVTVPPIVPKKISTAAAATVASAAAAKPAAPRSIVPIPKLSFKSVKSISDAASTAAPSAALTAPSAALTASVVTPRSIVPMQRKKLPQVTLSSVPEGTSATAAPVAAGKGKVYIGTLKRGASWSQKPYEGIKTVNVTSAQGKDNPYRRDFSPMTPIAGGYNGFWNFESYWQSGKVFEGIPKETSRKWWREQHVPKRKYAGPGSKGKQLHVLYSAWPKYTDNTGKEKQMQWIQSRKEVYIPEYTALVNSRASTKELQAFVNSGKDIIIYDVDGPKKADGTPATIEVTLDVLRQKINATDFPFGHGYIVAAMILGILPEEYTMPTAQDTLNVEIPEEEEVVEAPSAAAAAEP